MNDEKAAGRLDSALQRGVRPLRFVCDACGWLGNESDLLVAANPFDATASITGCPKCKNIDDLVNACDEPGCQRHASCGFPTQYGYRRTCGLHAYKGG
jgi:phage FluMu protein Com